MYRTHTCGELRIKDEGKAVMLAGWIHSMRYHGNVTFIDLRDRYGITQIVAENIKEGDIKREFVIQVQGVVKKKPQPNKKIATGAIEIHGEVRVLSTAKQMPIDIEGNTEMTEDTRLKHRYLDLRRRPMQDTLMLRSKVLKATRDFFNKEEFIELETPILGKSTPEGARDYLVPSRINKSMFYALPQSPQIFKQLFMIAGYDKYVQIVKCFRDEDLRKDRQPEFTQIDLEMSFIEQDDIIGINEKFMKYLWKEIFGEDISIPFQRMSYKDAMNIYGSDKPDLRFDLELYDVTDIMKKTEFNVFKNAKTVKCIKVKNDFSRKEIDKLTDVVKVHKAKGLAWVKYDNDLEGGVAKFLDSVKKELIEKLNLQKGETVFFVADEWLITCEALGALRIELANKLNLVKEEWQFCWVTDFPMFEWNEEDERYVSMHHPFTMPKISDAEELDGELAEIQSLGYDLTLNGFEIAGGSIRIHDMHIQKKVFEKLGLSEKEANEKFGFLIEALQYGAPPHGGIAFGFDRLVMLMSGGESIRDVIAFPKTKNAEDLMMGAPSGVKKEQLDELGLQLKK